MTCKDCIHFIVCDSGRHIGEHIEDDGVYSDGVEKQCPAFDAKNIVSDDGWLSTAERLPKEGELVLALAWGRPVENIRLLGAYYLAAYYKDEGWDIEGFPEWKSVNVTHWQSLPEPPRVPIKTVIIPASEAHDGVHAVIVNLRWICPVCGKSRGEIKKTVSYDGSRTLPCDGWENPCGHVDKYSDVRFEAANNDLN